MQRNYRGGDRAMSPWGQSLVKAIENEDTARQRNRNFREKAIFAGIQAGLTGARGIADSAYKASQQADKDVAAGKVNLRSDVSQDAFKALGPGAQDNYTKSREFLKGVGGKQYVQSGLPDYKSNDQTVASREAAVPSWLKEGGQGDVQQAAKLAQANQRMNKAAGAAGAGGYVSADGYRQRDNDSTVMANDTNAAMQDLNAAQAMPTDVNTGGSTGAGMMSSLPSQGSLASLDLSDPRYNPGY